MLFKSKKTLDEERPTFALLPNDDYELIITDCKPNERPKYMKPDQIEQIVDFTLEVIGTRDGTTARDIEEKDASGRKVFFTARPENIGFQRDGTPSKTRTLVAYAFGKDVNDEFEIEAWEQLLGKTIFAEIVQYTNAKGNKRNKISRLLLPPKNRQNVRIKNEEIPVIEE